jgi:flagellar biosynthesis chaperone FliJ
MNITEVRNVVRLAIAEAMEKEGGLPKSGGKLVHLKKELEGLKKMKESLGEYTINEGGDGSFVAEYAHMQKFVTELEKIKMAHAKLSEMLDSQISEVEGKVSSETQKVKEMMGLIEKAPKKPATKKDDKKAPAKKDSKKEEPKEEKPKADDKKKSKELDEAIINSNDLTQILKAAQAAIEAGKEVTVDGIQIGKVVPAAGAFIPADGSKPYPRVRDYMNSIDKIVIDGVPAELKAIEPKPFSGGSKNMSHDDWADRFGPGGGVDTALGRYTGD